MNFRRHPGKPFQFCSIDPMKRQAELQRRFGLPSTTNNDMFVDFLNPGSMSSGFTESSSLSGSPRLQHRVPIFTEKAEKDSFEQNNVDGGYKPKVRVVPIQVEGVDGSKRHRTLSGPAGMVDNSNGICHEKLQESFPCANPIKVEEGCQKQSKPRVYNIPVKIESRDDKPKAELKSRTPEPAKKLKSEPNGCAASSVKKEEPNIIPLKQIEAVLDKLKIYKDEVEKFSGTSKDKQYRYLDEMLTRCILDLDNVDTMGLDKIRKARKEAVRRVQHYVDLLDTKVNEHVEEMESDFSSVEDTKDGLPCDNPCKTYDTASPDSNNLNDECSGNVEMVGEITTEVTGDTKSSNVCNDGSIAGDVGIAEEKVTTQGSLMENEILMDSKKNVFSVDAEIVSTFGNSRNEAVSGVVSESPELGVKDAIIEEGDSEIVIEEVEDSRNPDEKESEQFISVCDSSVDKIDQEERLTVKQLNIKGDTCNLSNTNLSSDACTPIAQGSESDLKK